MNNNNSKLYLVFGIVLLMGAVPVSAYFDMKGLLDAVNGLEADIRVMSEESGASIQNSVHAEANTGGNTVGEGGTITTGSSKAEVYVEVWSGASSSASVYATTSAGGT